MVARVFESKCVFVAFGHDGDFRAVVLAVGRPIEPLFEAGNAVELQDLAIDVDVSTSGIDVLDENLVSTSRQYDIGRTIASKGLDRSCFRRLDLHIGIVQIEIRYRWVDQLDHRG